MPKFYKESIFNDKKSGKTHRIEIDRDLTRLFQATNDIVPVKRKASASDYTLDANDLIIGITDTSSARTVTLPKASRVNVGRLYYIKDESGGANSNNITIDGDGSETIDGATTYVINTNYGSVTMYSNGTAWFTL